MTPHDRSNAPPSLLTARPSPGALLRAAARRWFFTLTTAGLLGLFAGFVLWRITPLRYNFEVLLKVDPAPAGNSDKTADAGAELRDQADVIKSPLVLAHAVAEPELADIAAVCSWRTPAEKLAEVLHVDALPKESAVRIRAFDEDVDVALVIARTTANAYLFSLKTRRERHLQQLKDALTRDAVVIVKETPVPTPVETPIAPPITVDPRLGIAEKALAQVRDDRQKLVAELAALRAADKAPSNPAVSEATINETFQNDPFILEKQRELRPIEEVIQKTLRIAVLGEKEPSLKPYIARRDAIRQEMETRRTAIKKTLEQQARQNANSPDRQPQIKILQERLTNLSQQERTLEAQIESLRVAAAKVVPPPSSPPPPPPVVRVEAPVDTEGRRKLEAEIHAIEKKGLEPYWVSLLGENQSVDADSVRHRQQTAGLGTAAGILLGVLCVGLVEFRSRRVTAARDVSRGLGLSVFGTLPFLKLKANSLAVPGKVGDAVDIVSTALLGSVPDGPCVIVVTGSSDGEGKSALAAHLAASLARSFHKTVLIESDPRRSSLRRAFGLTAGPGLAEVLRGEVEALDAIQPTTMNRLWVMPAGRRNAAATQALARGEVCTVFEPLKEQYDCVVVDSSALGASRDTLLLCPSADAVLLSVLNGVSRLPEVYAAQQQLEAIGGPIVGAAVLDAAGEVEGGIPFATRRQESSSMA